MFFVSGDDDNPVAEAIRRHHDQAEMAREAGQMRVTGFLESLSPEDLATLRGMMNAINNDPSMVHFFSGLMAGMLSYKHGACIVCGKPEMDHGGEGDGSPQC